MPHARFTRGSTMKHIVVMSMSNAIGIHGLFCGFKWHRFRQDYPAIVKIALPAVLTNLAMPFSSAFITRFMAEFGDSFVAGYAIIGRLIPVAFGIVFALSGADWSNYWTKLWCTNYQSGSGKLN